MKRKQNRNNAKVLKSWRGIVQCQIFGSESTYFVTITKKEALNVIEAIDEDNRMSELICYTNGSGADVKDDFAILSVFD